MLVTRDPRVIRAISQETGDKPGQFDRDTLPTEGIARATGDDTLLFANGEVWKQQKKIAMPPFARTTLFQPAKFHEFEDTFRQTISHRLERVRAQIASKGEPLRVQLEPEVKAIMLEMLVNNFFGASVSYEEIRTRFVPSLDTVITHIVRDTVLTRAGFPVSKFPQWLSSGLRRAHQSHLAFEELTTRCLEARKLRTGLWAQFESDAPDTALRSNIRVFLAGALEATTSYACWAISHLSQQARLQEEVFAEVKSVNTYTPQSLANAKLLGRVLDETLRLTPSLYFHPRRATTQTTVTTSTGDTLVVPKGTHILLDIWHANRHEDHWGVKVTGFPANQFVPDRWQAVEDQGRNALDLMHFGFGHGPRFCPGKSLGQLEVALVVAGCLRLFRISAVNTPVKARAGVSTKPDDGVLVDLYLRTNAPQESSISPKPTIDVTHACPFHASHKPPASST